MFSLRHPPKRYFRWMHASPARPPQRSWFPRLEECEARCLLTAYYVAPSGSDGNPGTLDQPFQTIQQAANLMQPGDTAYLRAGVYRESVIPANSGTATAPITFEPYNGEQVTVSGADVIDPASWSLHSGHIYRAPLPWDLGSGNNQVFVDGQMMNEARWPNTGLDPSHPTRATATSVSNSCTCTNATATIYNSGLNQPAGYWIGATINIPRGAQWITYSQTVTDSGPGWISFQYDATNANYRVKAGNPFFLWGKFQALDSADEWYRDNTGQLYLWTPAGDSPANHTVEVKHRQYAFDFSSRSDITVEGLNLFAASITTNGNSHNIVLDGLNARYVSHYTWVGGWSTGLENSGIILAGHDNELMNSQIAYSAGNGVVLLGTHQTVFNNSIHDVNYAATDTGAVDTGANGHLSTGHVISYNTLTNSGRDLMTIRNLTAGLIDHNDLSYAGLQLSDLGAIYTYGSDGQGTRIAYNRIHDVYSPANAVGVYLDNGSSNYVVDHNVIWNVGRAVYLNTPSTNELVYDNTLVATSQSVAAPSPQTGTRIINNIFTKPTVIGSGAVVQNNLASSVNPQFVNAAQHDYHLLPNSPAIDAGRALPPYTDGYVGRAPDEGAYEYGLPDSQFPAGWTSTDIGGPAHAGVAVYLPALGFWRVAGGGDIAGSADQFQFASQAWVGDGSLTGRVTGVANTNAWAKAGVMFRDSTDPGVPYAAVLATPGHGVIFQWRSTPGGSYAYSYVAGLTAPVWVQLVRSGDDFTGYYSIDGVNWIEVGTTQTITMSDAALAGLAVTAHNNNTLAAATFTGVSLRPAGWGNGDISNPGLPGYADYDPSSGTWTVAGGGGDIWGTADQFHFAFASLTGDGSITAQVTGVQNTNAWAKAGVMFRDSADPNAPEAAVLSTPGNGVSFQWRSTYGGTSSYVNVTGLTAPVWVQLVRSGDDFSAFYSSDGVNWTQIGATQTIGMSDSVLAGLAVTAHNNAALNIATFTDVSVLPAAWDAADIGAPGLSGSSRFDPSSGTWRVAGGGGDIAGPADQFQFASVNFTGDGSLTAQVTGVSNTNAWAKAGVMFRDSADPSAPEATVTVAGGGPDLWGTADQFQFASVNFTG